MQPKLNKKNCGNHMRNLFWSYCCNFVIIKLSESITFKVVFRFIDGNFDAIYYPYWSIDNNSVKWFEGDTLIESSIDFCLSILFSVIVY